MATAGPAEFPLKSKGQEVRCETGAGLVMENEVRTHQVDRERLLVAQEQLGWRQERLELG